VVTLTVYAHLMKPINQDVAIGLEKKIFEINGSNWVAESENGTKKGLEV